MRTITLIKGLAAMLFILTACQKETELQPQYLEVYLRCKIDGNAYERSGISEVSINSRELSVGKYRNTMAWNVNSKDDLFVIEILDSTSFREGLFDASNYPLFEGPNFSISYRDEQGWGAGGIGTWNSDDATIHILKIKPDYIEGTFNGTFDNGVKVTDGEFRIFTGI